jgi:hypothetical protein
MVLRLVLNMPQSLLANLFKFVQVERAKVFVISTVKVPFQMYL